MNTESILESLLFISGEPVSFKKLVKITSIKEDNLRQSANYLREKYAVENRGIRILIKEGKIQMVTAEDNSEIVANFLKADIEGELSRAALEVVSIIAYRGPVSRSDIEEIRGVNCSFTLRHLAIRGLVEKINNPDDARAYLYRISFDFLKKLGIERVEDFPKYQELKEKEIFKNPKDLENGNKENLK